MPEVDPSQMMSHATNALENVKPPKVDKEGVWRWVGNLGTAVASSAGGSSRGIVSSPVMKWRPVVP